MTGFMEAAPVIREKISRRRVMNQTRDTFFSLIRIPCLFGAFLPVLLLAPPSLAGDQVGVAVLPFDIHSRDGREYLEENLPKVFARFLTDEGAKVIPPEPENWKENWRETVKDAGGIRRYGHTLGADYVVWGSLTRAGSQISIDARLISVTGTGPPRIFYAQGAGVERLSVTVRDLVRRMGLTLFEKAQVAGIEVRGNKRIEADAILRVIKTRPGDVFLPRTLSEDLKAVYRMGYFEDIRIDSTDGPDGKMIVFHVKEKPTIRKIRIQGNRVFEDKEILEALTIKTGALLNVYQIQGNLRRIEALYKDKNYHNVQVEYRVHDTGTNQGDLVFTIEEGGKVRVKEIRFIGNRVHDEDELKDQMQTTEKGFWSWLTSSGDLKREDLQQDVLRLTAFYHNNGYIDAKIGEPEVVYKEDWIYITIKVNEGEQFRIGKVAVTGDLVEDEAALLSRLKLSPGALYSRETVRSDLLTLSDIYGDLGYAHADVAPRIRKNAEDLLVDVSYDVRKGKEVFFEKIIISGNTETRDKVIRRQLPFTEQGKYSGALLKRGMRNMRRLDYFEDVKINTRKGSAEDRMIVNVDVLEKPTGTFSFGGGYSSMDKLFFMASVSQRNLFGLGQILQLKAELGGSSNKFTFSFTEPWLFDMPLSAGTDLYNWERDWNTYDRESLGGVLRFGYPVLDYTRLYLSYRYDIGDVKNITENASRDILELEGENVTSSATATLKYDSRDRPFNPTEGGNHKFSVEYAGLGGDIGFTKYTAEVGQYIPLFWNTVGYLHARGGYVKQNQDLLLPDYEKFYLGGINSLRGFDWRDISLKDEDGADIGGYRFAQFNAEFIFPLIRDAGVMGVIFYDTGNVYDRSGSIRFADFRQSCGAGFRWYSPMGPIRVEYGHVLDVKEGEEDGRWEFAMGHTF